MNILTEKMSVEEYRWAKRLIELEEKNKRLIQALKTLAKVEWDEWEEDDMSATAFKFVMMDRAGISESEMDFDSKAVKEAFPNGIPGIGAFIRAALEGGGE